MLKAGRARLDSGLLGSLMLLVAEAVPEVDERGLVEGLKAPVRPETRRRPENVLGARCRWVCVSVRRLVPYWLMGLMGWRWWPERWVGGCQVTRRGKGSAMWRAKRRRPRRTWRPSSCSAPARSLAAPRSPGSSRQRGGVVARGAEQVPTSASSQLPCGSSTSTRCPSLSTVPS